MIFRKGKDKAKEGGAKRPQEKGAGKLTGFSEILATAETRLEAEERARSGEDLVPHSAQQEPVLMAPLPLKPVTPKKEAKKETARVFVIAEGQRIDGHLDGMDGHTMRVEGSFSGRIPALRHLVVAEGAGFCGEAHVETAEIAGFFSGSLTVSGTLAITSTGSVAGRARYGRIAVAEGASLSGDIAEG